MYVIKDFVSLGGVGSFKGETLVLGILRDRTGLRRGVRIANHETTMVVIKKNETDNHPYPHPIILSPIRGGASIGVFMIWALKRSFYGV
jgi:hypothetical protein